MASVTVLGSILNTTAGNKTVTATPAVGDLIVVIAASTGVATTAIADTSSGTYVKVDIDRTGFSTTGTLNAWVRTTAISAAASNTWTATQTSSTGGGLIVYKVASWPGLFGASAVRSSGGQSTGTAATTPAPVLSLTPLSANPIITALANGTSAATITPRTGYTEDTDVGYSTPTTGFESSHRNSGETTATLTYGGTSASAFASIALELAADIAPTVVLNAPADTGTVTTTTPQLTFTGTDADGDAISYEVEVDTVNTFDSGGGGTSAPTLGSVIDSYSESNSSTSGAVGPGQAIQSVGQSFTGNGSTIGGAKFYISNSTGATGSITAKVYAHSGTFGTSSVPTGSALATSDLLDISGFSGSLALATLYFSGADQITLTNGTHYILVLDSSTINGSGGFNRITYGFDNTSPTHAGNYSTYNGTTWTANSADDNIFYVYAAGSPGVSLPLIDKLSNTDVGFTDITNGAHTDPFTSGEQIGYTVQAGDALTSGTTYYWRVRGKDPSGTNTYGAWATTRSFTVNTPPTVTLDSPADTATGVSTTPQLQFTGTDADSDAVTYEIQVGTTAALDAPALRSASGLAYASHTNPVLTAPAGIQNNDLLLIVCSIGNTTVPTPTAPTGFTLLSPFPTTATIAGFSVKTYVWYKVASSESGNYTITHTASSSEAWIGAYSGVNSTTPITVTPSTNVGTGTTTSATSITTTSNYSMVVFISQDWDDTNNNLSAPTGTTPTFTKEFGASTTAGVLFVADGVLPTAGATGSKTITNNSSVSNPNMGALIALNPAAAIVYDKLSNADSGFADITNGAHTDPFVSGEQVGYTTGTLTGGTTYYWRVRGKDPSGSNIYGAWPTTKSFTVSSGSLLTKTQSAVARIAVNKTLTQGALARIAKTVNKTQPATARVANIVTKTQPAVSRISNTRTLTQPAIARVAKNVTKTQSAVANIIVNTSVSKTQGATARIATNRALTQSAISRIAQNYTKTQPAVGRVANTRTTTQPATARIQKAVTKTQPAIARIATGLTKTQPVTSRISQTLTKTQPANARIAIQATKTQSAVAKIITNTTVAKTQPAIARIAVIRANTQSAVARIATNRTLAQPATARIATNRTATQPAVARIAKNITKTQPSIARIATSVTKTQPTTARIATNLNKTQPAVSRISNTRTLTQPSIARVANTKTKTQPATANIITNTSISKTQSAVARIATNRSLTQSAIARIATKATKTQPATSRISQNYTKTQPSTARIAKSVNLTQPATARIATGQTKTQPTISRIANVVIKTQPAIARVANTGTKTQAATANITVNGAQAKTQPATARIAVITAATQSALARIAQTGTKTQPAVARIATTHSKNITAISRISQTTTKTQPAIARLANNRTKTQPATANISSSAISTKTQPAVARIANTRTFSQPATARITVSASSSKTQPAIARIAVIRTNTQPAISRIAVNFSKTQSATANITSAITRTKTQTATAKIIQNIYSNPAYLVANNHAITMTQNNHALPLQQAPSEHIVHTDKNSVILQQADNTVILK